MGVFFASSVLDVVSISVQQRACASLLSFVFLPFCNVLIVQFIISLVWFAWVSSASLLFKPLLFEVRQVAVVSWQFVRQLAESVYHMCLRQWFRNGSDGHSNNNNMLCSSQREIKAVVRAYTLTHNEELNCTFLNNWKSWNTHTYTLLDIHSLFLNGHTLKHWSNANT